MKLSYTTAGLAVILIGLVVSAEAPLLSKIFLTKMVILEIPRKDFRLHVERIFLGDELRLEFDVQGGKRDIYISIERTHFYIGPRGEIGVPASVFTSTIIQPKLIVGSESIDYIAELEGHLNIFFNNTVSNEPKTVTYRIVFEKSSNMKYITGIIRNLLLLTGSISVMVGLIISYEDYRYSRKLARRQRTSSLS